MKKTTPETCAQRRCDRGVIHRMTLWCIRTAAEWREEQSLHHLPAGIVGPRTPKRSPG